MKKKNPNAVICNECKKELRIGDYPFCSPEGHTTIHSRNAIQGEATVVFRNAKGEYRFPGRSTDKVPKGFKRVELTTQRERDKFEKEFGALQTALLREKLHRDAYEREETFAAHRENLKRLKENSQSEYTKRFVDACFAKYEERKQMGPGNAEAGFYIWSNHHREHGDLVKGDRR